MERQRDPLGWGVLRFVTKCYTFEARSNCNTDVSICV